MSELPPINADASALIGRERELATVERRLEQATAAVIGLVAPVGMGKTSYLTELEARGRRRGWRTARGDEAGDLTVGSATTSDEFCARLRGLLEEPLDVSGVEATRETISVGTVMTSQALLHPLTMLRRALVMIDDFRSSPAFATWFTTEFVPTLRRAEIPVVVLVAGLPGALDGVAKALDETVVLAGLERGPVQAHFAAIASSVTPPLTPEEIGAYVGAATEHPMDLVALTRLLHALRSTPPVGGVSGAVVPARS